ncbi:MAG: hypothetical protein QOH69_2253 [Actinomycetota bacterium]|jgi:hypothetical protein|nr:hypothetical protein [Actinomycetota bacterium]
MDYSSLQDDGLIVVERIGSRLDDPRSLARDVARGLLVKLRRGVYVPQEIWAATEPRAQHVLRARAVLSSARRPIALAGLSAAAVWGIPIGGSWPTEVTVLDEWQGGGRTEPGVRRTAAGFRTARIVELGGLRVTDLTRSAIDVARRTHFADAVGSVDWALWRKNGRRVSKQMLTDDIYNLDKSLGRRLLERVVAFSTDLSDSYGESECRAVIHLLGFDAPELQVEFRDEQGAMYPDFFWRSVRAAAEFDGKAKYTNNEYTAGDPGEVVWREKRREDRLRRQLSGMTRILTSDVSHPDRLVRLLEDMGIPRGRRS